MSENQQMQPGVAQMSDEPISNDIEPGAQTQDAFSPDEKARLRREAAKYRTAAKSELARNEALSKELSETKAELERYVLERKNSLIVSKLDKAGCLKSRLVLADFPEDCDDPDEFIKAYKKENPFLFRKEKVKHGYAFKSGRAKNYSPSQQMNNLIRSALGR